MLCQVSPEKYPAQLADKVARLKDLISATPNLQVFESPHSHYRARAEFRIWHEGEESDYIMFNSETHEKVKIKSCPMAIEAIDNLMPELMAHIVKNPDLRVKLFQIDFLATLSGEMLVTLIYRRQIGEDAAWLEAAKQLKANLPITHLIGRARKQKVLLDQDYVTEKLAVDDQTFIYQQIENSFTQPNAHVAKKMLGWARQMCDKYIEPSADLIELYCGNGNFSIALADKFRQVLATEISKTSVYSAQFNIAENGVENLKIIKLAAEEISQALQGTRAFTRLKEIDLNSYNFRTIFVDPPRSGLDDLTRKMVTEFDNILYISCNPETLAFDLESIKQTHEVIETALFDQFPYTHHIESGVLLQRKSGEIE